MADRNPPSRKSTRTPKELAKQALAKELDGAIWLDLEYVPSSTQAFALVETLYELVVGWEKKKGRKYARRAATAKGLMDALGAFVADLLLNSRREPDRWSFRTVSTVSFTGLRVSYKNFTAARDALESLGLIEVRTGFRPKWGDGPRQHKASRFRGTPALMALVAKAGVDRKAPQEHFEAPLVTKPIVLHAGQKGAKKEVRIKKGDKVAEDRQAEVLEINEYLAEQDIKGGIHRGYRRIFKEGDTKPYRWDKYGRLHSVGSSNYQNDPKEVRLRMTINGEAVAELDVSACFLSIYYQQMLSRGHKTAKAGPGKDPYDVPGVPRAITKQWMVATFGAGKLIGRWSRAAKEALGSQGLTDLGKWPCSLVKQKMLEKHPVLSEWPTCGLNQNDLCYLESTAILAAMLRLKKLNVPSLSVYDCLIVPKSKIDLANNWLTWAFEGVAHSLRIKVSYLHGREVVEKEIPHPKKPTKMIGGH